MICSITTIDNRQLVVLKTNRPSVKLIRESDGYTASMELNFSDDEKGFNARDTAFEKISNCEEDLNAFAKHLDGCEVDF